MDSGQEKGNERQPQRTALRLQTGRPGNEALWENDRGYGHSDPAARACFSVRHTYIGVRSSSGQGAGLASETRRSL